MGQLVAFPKVIKLKGNWETREIWLNGRSLSPKKSQKVWNHSPDGFNFGYSGSGPAQLALAIMLELFPKDEALRLYQQFKRDVIAALPQSNFETTIDIDEWKRSLDKQMTGTNK